MLLQLDLNFFKMEKHSNRIRSSVEDFKEELNMLIKVRRELYRLRFDKAATFCEAWTNQDADIICKSNEKIREIDALIKDIDIKIELTAGITRKQLDETLEVGNPNSFLNLVEDRVPHHVS